MKQKFSFKKFFLLTLIILSASDFSKAQEGFRGAPLQPKFFIIGVEDFTFPSFNGNWNDTLSAAVYGLKISKWLSEHHDFFISQMTNPNAVSIFSWKDFAALDDEGRSTFKKIAAEYAPALRIQKQELIKKFQNENPEVKGQTAKNFYRDSVQVYFMSKKDVDFLIASLKK